MGNTANQIISWSESLSEDNVSGGYSPTLSEGDSLRSIDGGSFYNPRNLGVDGSGRLHADENLYLTANFRQKILIGGMRDTNNTLLPVWNGSNSIYQQVQINSPNIRGNFSIGTGLNSSTPIIGIGTEYSELRWGSFFIRPSYSPVSAVNFHTNGGAAFAFTDVYNRQMFRIQREGINSRAITCFTEYPTLETSGNLFNKSSLRLHSRYWNKNLGDTSGVDTQNLFEITFDRYSEDGNINFKSRASIEFSGNSIKYYENGDFELPKSFIQTSDTNKRVKWETVETSPGIFTLQHTEL